MEQQEIWKVWKDTSWHYKGHLYEVSDQGNVKIDGELLDFSDQKSYYSLGAFDQRVHRLVALLFVPNPNNYNEVDHINGDIHDNRACNLRWVTHSENMLNPITRKRRSESMQGIEPWNKGLKGAQIAWNKGLKGVQKCPTAGKITIHLLDKIKYVEEEYLFYWLDDGWELGKKKKK